MTLLDHYLRAVRMYLPKGRQQDDIISELAEHLDSKMEERTDALGRPLTEVEQEDVLMEHGNPMIVAGRYGATNLGFSFGRQLIGPELFPLYIRILLMVFGLIIVVIPIIAPFIETPMPLPSRLFIPMAIQFVIITFCFICIDAFQRRSRRDISRHEAGRTWRFPPAYLQRIPRYQSAVGLAVIAATALWWAAIPYAPRLILGPAATTLELAPSWHVFYWPILLLLLAGVAQRVINLLYPELNWLQPVTRLATNGLGVAMVYPFLRSYPYVVVAGAVANVDAASRMARGVNEFLWWNVLASFGLYWLINAGINAWLCLQHARYVARRRREQTS